MSDDLMQLEEVNQSESPAESTSQDSTPNEWKELDGKSQERFRRLANERKQAELAAEKERRQREKLEAELDALKRYQPVPMPATQNFANDEEAVAIKRLKELEMADRSYVDNRIKKEVEAIQNRLYLDNVHEKMEQEIASSKELPAYNRDEIESYMETKGIYDPRAAYRDLYHDEIVASEARKLTNNQRPTVKTEQTKSRIGVSEPWTKESLASRLRQPDGVEFFKKNRDKILKMQGQLD